jgi:hypothetical protein
MPTRWITSAALAAALLSSFSNALEASGRQPAGVEVLSSRQISPTEKVGTIRLPAGTRVRGPIFAIPPPPPGLRGEEEEEQLGAPIRDDGLSIPPEQAVETSGEVLNAPLTPGTSVVLRDTALAPPFGFSSSVNEPSVGGQGNGIFITHNWYAAVSTDNGSSFSYVSPFTTFPNTPSAFAGGFCCDQRAVQDSTRNLVFWFMQWLKNGNSSTSSNGDRLAVAHGQAGLGSNAWTYFDVTPSMFSLTGKWLDFPHLQASANFLYFTSNIFQTTNDAFYGAVAGRIPLAQLDAGGPVTVDYFLTTTFGSIGPVNGASAEGTRPGRTTMYFASLSSTTGIKVLIWPEASSSPTVSDVTGLATTSLSTYVCTGPDGFDPCTRANGRVQTGWITDTELGFMWASSQNAGAGRPYPYTRVVILDPGTLAVVSQPDIWSSTSAWLYPAVAVNERGHLGGVIDNLGGSLLPTLRAVIRDDFSPDVTTSGWETFSTATSTHGTSGRWGDFNGSVPHEEYPATWLATGHVQNGGSTNSFAVTHNLWFGRERDTDPALTVTRTGGGTGTVTSSPPGINCGGTCSGLFSRDATVTLTATPDAPAVFAGWSGAGCSGTGTCVVTLGAAQTVTASFVAGLDFYTASPCRVLDTRTAGPQLVSGVSRSFTVAGVCGVPLDAAAVVINVTVVTPPSSGHVTVYPGGSSLPPTSTLNFRPGLNIANNAIVGLGSGALAAQPFLTGGGGVDLIVDIYGYFK